jgi:glucose-6-phosphate isomerase
VNIGIGGSDLGPAMAYAALRRYREPIRVHFVSNVDPADLDSVITSCDPKTTLFVVVSKTFTTAETMRNAARAKKWLADSGINDTSQHFVACTSAPDVARRWGIEPNHVLEFWSWVGGRFSLSSVAGFSLLLGIGADNFRRMLHGMHTMDLHFATAELHENVPAVHGLISFMNASIAGWNSIAVVPYSHDLSRLPAFLQQLIMESNGKSVKSNGEPVVLPTSPVVWGEAGTNGQHAFFQLLHQGTHTIPVDFIGVASPSGGDKDAHEELVANMIAQSRALAFGRSREEVEDSGSAAQLVNHRVFPGNRPSTTIFATELTPEVLGEIIALYEHSTAVQGWMMGVNSFDQWGVELGKTIAKDVVHSLHHGGGVSQFDSSTNELLHWYLSHRD